MKVADLMSSPVLVVSPDALVGDVARLMVQYHIRGLPVVDGGALVGFISDADLVARHARPHFPLYIQVLEARLYLESPKPFEETLRKAAAHTAREVMSTPVTTVDADTEVEDVAALMFEKGFKSVPVLRDGQLAGVITRTDLLRLIVTEETESTDR